MPYVREISISFIGVCGYNELIKFNEANFVFADVLSNFFSYIILVIPHSIVYYHSVV